VDLFKPVTKKSVWVSLFVFALLVSSFTVGYDVHAASLSYSTVIENGSMAETASYIIFKDGSTYYAKNGTTGAIDYSGTNATYVIKSAIDSSSKGLVFIMAGTYVIDSTIILDEDNADTIVRGEYQNATILTTNSATIDIISIQGTGHIVNNWDCPIGCVGRVTIENLAIKSNVARTSGAAIHLKYVWFNYLKNIWFFKQYQGVHLENTDNVFLYGCQFRETMNNSDAILADGSFNINLYMDSCASGNRDTSPTSILNLVEMDGFWVTDCEIGQANRGIKIEPSTGHTVRFGFISGTSIDNQKGSTAKNVHITSENGGQVYGIRIVNSWLGASGGNAIRIAGSNVSCIQILGCKLYYAVGTAILIEGGTQVEVSDCEIIDNNSGNDANGHGIYVAANVAHFTIKGNFIRNLASLGTGHQKYGIYLAFGTSDYYMVTLNNMIGNEVGEFYDGGTGAHKVVSNNI